MAQAVVVFYYDERETRGKYRSGGWENVHLQKRLMDQPDKPEAFELMIDPEPKKLE